MTEMPNVGPLPPHERKLYEAEYKEGIHLFQEALEEFAKSTNDHQKLAFKEVMDQALDVLNKTARELKNDRLLTQTQAIETDFHAYTDNPQDGLKDKLTGDLGEAERFFS